MKKIVAAAILFKLTDNEICLMTDRRHSDIFRKAYQLHLEYKASAQGFLTNDNQFVDRYEAKKIAVAADQLIVPEEDTYAELYSEDLW